MNDKLIIGLFVLILLIFAMYLHAQNKLLPVGQVIFGPDDSNSKMHLGELALAFVGYLIVLSIVDTRTGIYLTLILVFLGLIMDQKQMGTNSILDMLTSGSTPTDTGMVTGSSMDTPSTTFPIGPIGGNTTRNT